MRLCLGITLIAAGTMMIGEARQAFMMLLLSSAVPPAVYFGVRPSIPYGFGIAALVAAIGSSTDAPWAPALAFCSAVALLTVVVSMMIAQGRTRMYARAHRAMAYSDPLTGLANTRALREALERALNCESSEATPVALFAIDLDNFKLVNDEFDHARGDEVLKAVATELSAAVEPGDMVARRGGDEFSVLIANPEGRDLDTLRESLTDAIHHARMRTCPEISPSGSAAYVHSKPGDEVTSLLREADAELHTAKVEFHQADQGVRRPRLAIIDNRSETDRANEEKASAAALDDRRAEERFDQEKPWWRGSTSVDRPLWGFAAMMTAILGATIGVVSAAGWTGELTASRGGAIAGGFALIVALAAAGSIAPLRASFIHLIFLADVAVLSTAVLVAGESGAALIDLYAIIAMFAFHFFSPAVAARYLPVTIGLYGTLAYTGDFPYAIGRSATFGVMMLSSAVLVGKVRMVTRTFILRNFELSQRDALTSTANVRAMRIRVSGVVKNAETGKREPAIIAIDLDEFKEVNDNFGHSVGDEVLVSVARAILDNV
ncbi:MAG TPA: diguanylate cyclase, partial [Solirubrobacterales bacterium]|nr:diguanylate cyclase [Solirubrobacterales bacterium]